MRIVYDETPAELAWRLANQSAATTPTFAVDELTHAGQFLNTWVGVDLAKAVVIELASLRSAPCEPTGAATLAVEICGGIDDAREVGIGPTDAALVGLMLAEIADRRHARLGIEVRL